MKVTRPEEKLFTSWVLSTSKHNFQQAAKHPEKVASGALAQPKSYSETSSLPFTKARHFAGMFDIELKV